MATKYALIGVAFSLFVGSQAHGQQADRQPTKQASPPTFIMTPPPRELTPEEKYEVKKPQDDHRLQIEKPEGERARDQLPPPTPQLREWSRTPQMYERPPKE